MDIKVGDVVHVRGVVTDVIGPDGGDARSLFTVGFTELESADAWPEEIVHVEPRALQVGDRVKRPVFRNTGGEIRAIDGNIAWIKHDDGIYANANLAELERA